VASEVEICNRALQKLGAQRITSLTENSRNARECNAAYSVIRDAELRAHPWSFARARAALAADGTAPAFGYSYQYQLPADFLRMIEDNDRSRRTQLADRQIEGGYVLTDQGGPLQLVYIRAVTDPNLFDPMFAEAFSTRLALELVEKITESSTKKESLREDYKTAIRAAKRANAIERPDLEPEEDDWVTVRG
jgi:hypothetical protein